MLSTILDWSARVALFGLVYWLGYERGRRVEVDAQLSRIEALLERIRGAQ